MTEIVWPMCACVSCSTSGSQKRFPWLQVRRPTGPIILDDLFIPYDDYDLMATMLSEFDAKDRSDVDAKIESVSLLHDHSPVSCFLVCSHFDAVPHISKCVHWISNCNLCFCAGAGDVDFVLAVNVPASDSDTCDDGTLGFAWYGTPTSMQ